MTTNTIKDNLHIQEMYEDYFLEYASYVVTDRAVPYLEDGLKPVQRRILHSLFELDDGRFHKAANVIGNTMKFHPHGDAAIRDAMVNLSQKGLLIETQGNWGDPRTGDAAAAPRYIECKLSKFALEVVFNKKTTEWQRSYDGRNLEPVALPVKFPLLLAQGAEGIAVGLSTKIMPHNFRELIQCCIKVLKKEPFQFLPDFLTGGFADFSNYNDGMAGGRIKIRAKIETTPRKALIIREIPYGTTTASLMDSIVTANEKGKIKIKRIEDNTAQNIEIIIYLSPGTDPEKTIDALYAFTDCEVSVAPNCCVIRNKRPAFIGVSEVLRENVKDTVSLLKAELLIKKQELEEKHHFRTLEQIFIEERIYRKIEKCATWEAIVKTIHEGLKPFSKKFIRKVTDDDITRLTEIRIKRISRFDADRAGEEKIALEKGLAEVRKNLKNLTKFAVGYFQGLLEKYGKGHQRKTIIQQFESIAVADVILSNLKVYYDRKTGFIGTGVKAEKFIPDCSKLDELIVFTEDGAMTVTKVADKTYVGKNILHAAKFEKENSHIIYNMIYRSGRSGPCFIKRFAVGGVTRGKQYSLTKGKEQSKVFYLSVSPRENPERVEVRLVPRPRIKKTFEVAFADYEVKGRSSGGNRISKYAIRSVKLLKGTAPPPPAPQKSSGNGKPSTSKTREKAGVAASSKTPAPAERTHAKKKTPPDGVQPVFWNKKNNLIGFDVKGEAACSLGPEDSILLMYNDGSYITYKGRDVLEVGEGLLFIDRLDPNRVYSTVYMDGNTYALYGKRFKIPSSTDEKYYYYISDYEDSQLQYFTTRQTPVLDIFLKPLKGEKNRPLTIFMNDAHFPVRKVGHIGERITARAVKAIKPSKKTQLSLL